MLTQETPPEIAAEMAASVAERDRHFRWNFAMMGFDIAFFTLGMNISSAYVVLPLFVHHLSSSNIAAALAPAIRALGIFGTQLILAGYVEGLRRTKPILLIVTTFERLPYLVLAGAALLLAESHPFWLLALFFLLILMQTFGSGLSMTPWLDLVARAIPDNWRGRFFGLSTSLGGLLGIGGAALATLILSSPTIGYPANFALCFSLTFGMMIISFIWLALTREPRRIPHPPAEKAARKAAGANGPRGWLRILRQDGGFRLLLIANAIAGASALATGLYAFSAKNEAHLTDAQVSIQNTVLIASSTASYFILGLVGDRYGHRLVLEIGALAGALAGLLALLAHGPFLYAGIFLLTGVSLSATLLASFSFVIEFGPPEARPTYIALSSLCYAPGATFAPLVGGWLADHLGYGPPFLLAAALGIIAALFYRLRVPDPRMDKRRKQALAGADARQAEGE
ncbi:MAG TPA: MFS transporter [Ktedonobacterales bacterium]|jgi:MFS family permease